MTAGTGAWEHHLRTTLDLHHRRQLVYAAQDVLDAAQAGHDPAIHLARLNGLRDETTTGTLAVVDLRQALDLDLPEPGCLYRTDGRGLFYAGSVNYAAGEPGQGKSILAQLTAVAELNAGRPVVILDFEDTAGRTAARLKALGATTAHLDQVAYAADPTTRHTIAGTIARVHDGARLVVIDGVAAAMTAHDLSEDDAGDLNRWWDSVPGPIAAAGATVLAVDHVTKAREGRGLWPRGSGAKKARIDGAAYMVETTTPFSRTRPGRIKLTLAKDRHGGLDVAVTECAATVYIEPHDGGRYIRTEVDPPIPETDDGPGARSTRNARAEAEQRDALAAAIPTVLELAHGPLSKRGLIDRLRAKPHRVKFNDKLLGPALVELVDAGDLIPGTSRGHDVWSLPPRQQVMT